MTTPSIETIILGMFGTPENLACYEKGNGEASSAPKA
jgi:hypothetical protein